MDDSVPKRMVEQLGRLDQHASRFFGSEPALASNVVRQVEPVNVLQREVIYIALGIVGALVNRHDMAVA